MKKAISLIGILAIMSVLLCACIGNGDLGKHVHGFSSKWSYNAAEHYHKCRGCDEVTDNAAHTYENNRCKVCGYERISSEGLEYKLNTDRQSYSAVGIGTCKDVDLVIPDSYLNYPVTSVGEAAFYNCTELRSVAIPESVTSLGAGAFSTCSSLQSMAIGENVTNIGEAAFYNCSSLQRIVIPDSVTSIGRSAFFNCTKLKSAEISDSITILGDYVFNWCTGLQSVVIGDSVTTIGEGTFSDCTNLQSAVIPDNVTTIGEGAFAYCINLHSIVIGVSVTSIESRAFEGCYKLIEVYNISSLDIRLGSDQNGRVGFYAKNIFYDKTSESKIVDYQKFLFYANGEARYLLSYIGTETSIALPENYNGSDYEIYEYAFYCCETLQSAVISDNVTRIGESAFAYCTNLQSVVIGNSVKSIGNGAFSDCTNLQSIYYYGTEEAWNQIEINAYNQTLKDIAIYYYTKSDPQNSDDYNEKNNYWHYGKNGKIVVWGQD